MIDTGASVDILFNHCYEQIRHNIPMKLRSYDHDLYSFDGKPLRPRGIIKLPLELKDDPDRKGLYTSHDIEFLVVNIDSPYKLYLGETLSMPSRWLSR